MNKMKKLLGLLVVAAISAPVHAQAVDFWHSDTIWANQGMCSASFTFDSSGAFSDRLQNLKVTFNALDAQNKVVDTATLEIDALGGDNASRYAYTSWASEHACDSDLRLQVISAHALIDGQQQDLLAKGEIAAREFIPFQITVPAPRAAQGNACNNPRFNLMATIVDKDGYSNVRVQPNAKSTIVEKVFEDDHFYTFQQKGNWWQVCTPSGQVGYIYHDRIKF